MVHKRYATNERIMHQNLYRELSLYITQALHVNNIDVVTYKLKPPNHKRERGKNPFS